MAREYFMEYIHQYILQTVADTDVTEQIALPTSESEELAMLIHTVEWEGNLPARVAAATIGLDAYLHYFPDYAPQATHITDPQVISMFARYLRDVGGALDINDMPQHQMQYFAPPILVAQRNIYLTLHTSASTVVNDAGVRIGYTLEKVGRDEFISALVRWR